MEPSDDLSRYLEYVRLRRRLLGSRGAETLPYDEMAAAMEVLVGEASLMAIYGLDLAQIRARGIRIAGRTLIECTVDVYAAQLTDRLNLLGLLPTGSTAGAVFDLFCGSGNLGFTLGRESGSVVYGSELDEQIFRNTCHNFDVLGTALDLRHCSYEDLLDQVPQHGPMDVYLVDPPWGDALSGAVLDPSATSPSIVEVFARIGSIRRGAACTVVLKANSGVDYGDPGLQFDGFSRRDWLLPLPASPRGGGQTYGIYRLEG